MCYPNEICGRCDKKVPPKTEPRKSATMDERVAWVRNVASVTKSHNKKSILKKSRPEREHPLARRQLIPNENGVRFNNVDTLFVEKRMKIIEQSPVNGFKMKIVKSDESIKDSKNLDITGMLSTKLQSTFIGSDEEEPNYTYTEPDSSIFELQKTPTKSSTAAKWSDVADRLREVAVFDSVKKNPVDKSKMDHHENVNNETDWTLIDTSTRLVKKNQRPLPNEKKYTNVLMSDEDINKFMSNGQLSFVDGQFYFNGFN